MLPTSRPRVGWSRMSSFSARSNSRATTSFCWLPPDSVPADTLGEGARTSYFAMPSAAAFSIAVKSRRTPWANG